MNRRGNNICTAFKQSVIVGLGAFFLAIGAGSISQGLLKNITSLVISFFLLITIILIGIVFDIIGVAATAASETPFHAKAAKRVMGSRQAINIVRNADRVASFCNDVVGDVSGTLSGAIGAAIIFRLFATPSYKWEIFVGTFMTAVVAGLTVGGKAFGKSFALRQANEITFKVGQVLAWLERNLRINLLNGRPKKGRRK